MSRKRDSADPVLRDAKERAFATALSEADAHHERYYSMRNWLLATLVAINGGAILALTNLDMAVIERVKIPGLIFVAGVISAVLSGFGHMGELNNLGGIRFLEGLFQDKVLPSKFDAEMRKYRSRADWMSSMSNGLNGLSLLLFVAGSIGAGYLMS